MKLYPFCLFFFKCKTFRMQYRCRFNGKAMIQSFSNAPYMSRHVCCGLFSGFYLGGGKIQKRGRNFSLDYATTVASKVAFHCALPKGNCCWFIGIGESFTESLTT